MKSHRLSFTVDSILNVQCYCVGMYQLRKLPDICSCCQSISPFPSLEFKVVSEQRTRKYFLNLNGYSSKKKMLSSEARRFKNASKVLDEKYLICNVLHTEASIKR